MFGSSLTTSDCNEAAPILRRGVAVKLRNAFVGVSLFSLLAALVGIASYEVIERVQDEVLDRSLPAALGAERMVKLGLSVVAAAPALLAAKNNLHLEREAARIQSAYDDFRRLILRLRGFGVAEELLGLIEADLDAVFANLNSKVSLVGERNELRVLIAASANQATGNAEQLIAILKPLIVEASSDLLAKSDEIRLALSQPQSTGQGPLAAFEELANESYYEIERLNEMRFRAEKLINLVDALSLTVSPESVVSIRDAFSLDLRSLARSTLEVREPSFRNGIGQLLQGLSEAAHGPADVFSTKSKFIAINRELDRLGADNRDRAEKLLIHVDQLLVEANSLINASSEQARDAVSLGRIVLAAIAAVAFAVAIFVIWRYVLQDVVARIRRLAGITRELAEGNLEVKVDVAGADELGDMAEAVRVFKVNATELRRSNLDLEQFAYVASHDLKAPLRGISNLATWIEQDLIDVMGEETKQHLTLLQGRVDRMETLLEDLLLYSRVGRDKSELRMVDLNDTVPEIFKLMALSDQFTLRLDGPLPRFVTARAPLEQVFRNLIGNAVKHHDADGGVIDVSVTDLGQVYEFRVRDDGPGVAPEYQDKIFNLFQTLKARDEIEGSGMGLAIVQRIVTSVGCTIVIESDPSSRRGTGFRFTWPKQWQNVPTVATAA